LTPFINNNIKKIVSYGKANNKISIALRDAVELKKVFSLRDAVGECKKSAVSGDVILLSPGCASFDQFRNYEHRGNEFKKIVKNVVYA
jgi:UDP-N-acetylmuramoylalanine--D-glutamate ligase